MSHEMYESIQSFSCTPLKNTSGLPFLSPAHNRKGNSCLFEICVKLQLQTRILNRPKSRYPVVHKWIICDHYRGVQSTEIYYPRGYKYF